MKAIFNSRIIDTSKPLIPSSNRAFCYGDGLFETIVTGPDRIDLIGSHLGRMERGCQVLEMDFPAVLTEEYLREAINQLAAENGIKGSMRTKLMVWRNEGGLYAPEESSSNYLLECKPATKRFFRSAEEIGVSEVYHTHWSPISFAKTMNALNYVLAGKEMTRKGWDEIILTDYQGHISESHIANIFWIANGKLYTPPSSTGCIEGIMRKVMKELAANTGIAIHESLLSIKELDTLQSIFSTNASGITWFKKLEERQLENPEEFLTPILKQLLRP
ncbi:MAG: aminotransferase class IV [Cytophagia bacterium]|nr:aminotransferase class IV [Cytophagia bacterium]